MILLILNITAIPQGQKSFAILLVAGWTITYPVGERVAPLAVPPNYSKLPVLTSRSSPPSRKRQQC